MYGRYGTGRGTPAEHDRPAALGQPTPNLRLLHGDPGHPWLCHKLAVYVPLDKTLPVLYFFTGKLALCYTDSILTLPHLL